MCHARMVMYFAEAFNKLYFSFVTNESQQIEKSKIKANTKLLLVVLFDFVSDMILCKSFQNGKKVHDTASTFISQSES